LVHLLTGRVICERKGKDAYKRTLAECYRNVAGRQINVSDALLAAGVVQEYRR
jgi:endonuclease YncB( thermonuclease family)